MNDTFEDYEELIPIERFATHIVGKPLYPYQAEAARAILHSIDHHLGWIITVMMSRQSGKNQLSAILEAFLMCTRLGGMIVKAAPIPPKDELAKRWHSSLAGPDHILALRGRF